MWRENNFELEKQHTRFLNAPSIQAIVVLVTLSSRPGNQFYLIDAL